MHGWIHCPISLLTQVCILCVCVCVCVCENVTVDEVEL